MKTTRSLLALLLLLAGCNTPAPFDPVTDCAKETYCGQCASRGACAWCGPAGDSGEGRCVAVGHAECAAPSAWSKTPDRCPAPPATAVSPALASSAAEAPSSGGKLAERRAAIRRALVRAFPQATVNDEVVDGVAAVLALGPHGMPAHGPKDARGVEVAPIEKHVREKDHRLYLGYATHHRVRSPPPESKPMESKFTLALPMVRVTLPEKIDAGGAVIATEIGDVDLTRDHLLGSVDLVDTKYGGKDYLGARPARVDLITPARAGGSRFGAIAIYLGYRRKTDRGPSFYMFEAGTATGDAKMIYFSPDMRPIERVTSYYLPTPFVSMANTYSGGVTMRPAPDEDEPETLVIRSQAPGDRDPYITVTLKYKRAAEMDVPLPVEITADAGARVAMIARTLGVSSAVELQPVLAELARTLHWEEIPRYTVPAPTATVPAPTVPVPTTKP